MPVSGTNNNRTPLVPIQNESQKPAGKQDGKGVLHVKGNGLQVRTPDNFEISSRPRKRKLQSMSASPSPAKKYIPGNKQDKENLDRQE